LILQVLLPVFFLVGYGIVVSRSLMRYFSLFEGTELLLAVAVDLLPVFIIGLWIVGYPRLAEKQVKRTVERWFKDDRARLRFERATLTVTTDGLIESSELERTHVDWRAVRKIERTDSHLYVWFGGGKAFIVPRRVFPDDATYQGFAKKLERLRTSAGDAPRPVA
jgi:hypothetical protein